MGKYIILFNHFMGDLFVMINSKVSSLVVDLKSATSDAIRVDRNTDFGNPFKIETMCDSNGKFGRRNAILAFIKWLATGKICDKRRFTARRAKLLKRLPELKGKTLACHCVPQRCHGEVLALLANDHYTPKQLWDLCSTWIDSSKTKKGA